MSDDKPGASARPDEDPELTAELGEPETEDGHGMPGDLEALLDDADEEAAEEADDGRFDAPPLPPLLVLAVVGLLCGFAVVALVWLSERGCDRVRDTPNCGALGLPLLILTVVVSIVLGAFALGRLAMPHPQLVAFLGVTFMLLIVVGFGSDDLFSTWTLLVVPATTAITFLVAHLIAGRLERADA